MAVALAYGALPGVIAGLVRFFLLPLTPMLLIYRARRSWRASWYALTDQRVVVAGTGPSASASVATDFPLRISPGVQIPSKAVYRVKQISVAQGFSGMQGGLGTSLFSPSPQASFGRMRSTLCRSEASAGSTST